MPGIKKALLCLSGACLFTLSGAPAAAPAAAACADPIARVVTIQGDVQIRAQQVWQSATLDQALCAGDELQVLAGGRSVLRIGATTLPLDQNTRLILRGIGADGKTQQIELLSGNINVATDASAQIQIITPHGKVSTAGGDFAVSVNQQQAALSVFGGKVAVSNPEGSLDLLSDETAYFAQLSAPRRDITVKARDSVQWVVQYPALLPSGAAQPSAWTEAARQYEQGHVLNALIALDQVPASTRNADYYNYRANIYLLSGRAADAMSDIEQAKKLNPGSADTWALQAIFDLGQNNSAAALTHAGQAIKLNPGSPAAQLAHSYALQANRRPDDALAAARRMVELAPDNALGHARVAELELARGDRAAALRAAQRAAALAPNSSDAQTILGFCQLSADQDSAARSAFERAVHINSADPRARMGLGLTRIRQGQLQAGREDLELAASLDPENPLFRAYLGRAYAEEGRVQDATEQYARAQRNDPQDPTAFFFSALLMAENNQPVSALAQMQEALARNENRAVYRGEALIDEDKALRLANSIALMSELGAEDAARTQASASISENPNSGVAHRAYGNALASLPRGGDAQRSEYLQAMLNEPLGVLPPPLFQSEGVQRGSLAPQRGFLRSVESAQISLNEFSAVFRPVQWQGNFDGIVGGQNTSGQQIQVAGKYDRIGWSFSELSFRTDGFGPYNRLENMAWRGNLQADLTQSTRLGIEKLQYHSNREDIIYPQEPFDFYRPQQVDDKLDRNRLGIRQRIGDTHEFSIWGTWEDTRQNIFVQPTIYNLLTEPLRQIAKDRVFVSEFQYRFHSDMLNLIVGNSSGRSDQSYEVNSSISNSVNKVRAQYLYATLRLPNEFQVEIGQSRDNQKGSSSGINQGITNPKYGLRWQPFEGGSFRLADYRTVNQLLSSGGTLEPTQIAGFTQRYVDSYNDTFGVREHTQVIGWDQRLAYGVSWGISLSSRHITIPIPQVGIEIPWSDKDERAYIAWAVPQPSAKQWLGVWDTTFTLGFDRQSLKRDESFVGNEEITQYRPAHMRLGATFYHPAGWGLRVAATRVHAAGVYQTYDELYNAVLKPFDERFWSVDAALTYRFPSKRGEIALGAKNLNNHHSQTYLELDVQNPRFAAQRLVYGRLVLNF